MIELRTLEGERIDLSSSAITIELSNAFFAANTIPRSGFSYPIQLANTSKNRKFFRFFDLLETSPTHPQIPVFMRINGRFYAEATLHLGLTSGSFSGHLLLKTAAINDKLDNKLTDIPFQVFNIGGEGDLASKFYSSGNDWRKNPYVFPPVKNNDFFSSVDGDRILNYSMALAFLSNSPEKWAPLVPCFYLCYVLENIAGHLNLNLSGDFAQHADVQKIVIPNPVGIGLPYGITISAKNHLPPLSLKEFFRELSFFFGVVVSIAEGNLNISFKKAVFEHLEYIDWTGKKKTIISQEFASPRDGYLLSADAVTPNEKDEVIVGNGKLKMNTKIASLPFCSIPRYFNSIPEDKCKGVLLPAGFKAVEKTKDLYLKPGEVPTFPLRLLFCNNGTSNAGQFFNLKMSGRNGLYEFAHRGWMEKTHAARVIKMRVLLNGADLQQLNESKIIRLKSISGAVGECMWRRLTFSASEGQNILPAEVELIVLNPSKI